MLWIKVTLNGLLMTHPFFSVEQSDWGTVEEQYIHSEVLWVGHIFQTFGKYIYISLRGKEP